MKRSYGVRNLMTISVWVSSRNVSFVFTSFLLKNGQNLYFRISCQPFFNFLFLFGDLMFYFIYEFIYMNSYSWISYHQIFAPRTLCLSGCVARIADFGPSEPGTKPGERTKSPWYAKTTYTLWIICFKPGSIRGSISRPFDLKSNALPLRHGGKKIFGKKIWVFTPHTFLRGWLS